MKKSVKILSGSLIVVIAGGYVLLNKVICPLKFEDSIKKYSTQYNVDPYLVASVINNESRFKEITNYDSQDKNGIIQVREFVAVKWANEMGLKNFEPKDIAKTDVSINMACWYLSKANGDKATSWVNRNVKEDTSNKFSDKDIKLTAKSINDNITLYKIAHPFLKK
ncbi:Transglycosylase SLT domain-containing protein [Clostridium cavendishii DSM 21758]|uniref:Transglycosylase SLT domain-containing protein n=1 Tax=Clostridium cavendishii DSM 21758 TaxID=1121302 RepID=A0A1M6QVF7_9CLOT|nr:transglycosylase SLT domain-containing protein [Clostridium cavendishii]SHK24185.1 Transglycosylase SLT domain-containing protein [Clostridium cavendishii DSM 21758]